ncbi:dUTP diphosphatase [Bacillaceae bacterium IKA-2]|nr:dUTP diphosphatase [Bacillaceae bacterium IKA-2]
MNIEKLFQMQTQLDDRIRQEHNLIEEDLMDEKILAFQVELGELANETRCFKYWSIKPASEREVILEEYVDGVHFLLSIGLELQTSSLSARNRKIENQSLTKQFMVLFQLSSQLGDTKKIELFEDLFQQYLHLGDLLNYSIEDIEIAYIGKNEVNHQRQNEGY